MLILNPSIKQITDGKRTGHLAPLQCRIVEALASVYPGTATLEEIKHAIWPRVIPGGYTSTFRCQVSYIRREMRFVGFDGLIYCELAWTGRRAHAGKYGLTRPVAVSHMAGVMIPATHVAALRDLLASHPDRSAADRVAACVAA